MHIAEWLNNDDLAIDIWKNKYQYDNENFEQWIHRVSGGDKQLAELMKLKRFLFGGRILANRGLNKDDIKVTYSNCYVLPRPEDNIESIYETASKLARTFSYGGGVGIDISNLRPKGALVRNSARETTGAVSFMDTFSLVTETIGQRGRRGALMISMDVNHPDIEDFIDIKKDLTRVTKANISVRITDAFMEAVYNDEPYDCTFEVEATGETVVRTVNAKELFMKLSRNNWEMAEPGILFWDNINKYNLMSDYIKHGEFEYAGVNPCLVGDTKVQTVEGEIAIKDLVGKKPYVYCMNEKGELDIKQASKVWLTRKNANLVKVTHSRGDIICTPEHKIYTKNRGWVEAHQLKPKDKLIGLNRCMKDEKHCAVALRGQAKYIPEHRFILGKFQNIEGLNVHHLNGNPLDNRLSNLEALTHSQHSKLTNTGRQIEVKRDSKGRYVEKEVKSKRETLEVNSKNRSKSWNVISVEFLDYTEDVYDMTVEEHHNFVANGIIVHNCAEETLPAGGSCNLGSINLSAYVVDAHTPKARFDYLQFTEDIPVYIRALNNVLVEGRDLHPLAIQRETIDRYRQIGLGVMGVGDMLIKLGITYGSDLCKQTLEAIGHTLLNESLKASAEMAILRGSFEGFNADKILNCGMCGVLNESTKEYIRQYGLYNSQILTTAPTGSISTMLGISGGIEPLFALTFTRKTESIHDEDVYYQVEVPVLKEYQALYGEDVEIPKYFITSHQINPFARVEVQASWQKYIDASISSTINLDESVTVEEVFDIYCYAHQCGLKGLTIYRNNCARSGVLTVEDTKEEETDEEIELLGVDYTEGSDTVSTSMVNLRTGEVQHIHAEQMETEPSPC